MSTTRPLEHDITVEDVSYFCHAGEPLLARLYLPVQACGPVPLVAEVHGGAWCRGSRLDEDGMNRALARRGIAVAALDFRMPPVAGYPASLQDINYGVRWLKTHAARLGSRPDLVSLMGLSSGAHQAMLAAMRPQDARYAAFDVPDASPASDAVVRSVVMCWPVINPPGRYHYAREWKDSGRPYPEAINRVIPDHLHFWGSVQAMEEGSPVRILASGEVMAKPPVFCLQGTEDKIHPRPHIEEFALAYREAGGNFTMRWFENEAESFINKKPDASSTLEAIDAIAQFLHAGARSADTVENR